MADLDLADVSNYLLSKAAMVNAKHIPLKNGRLYFSFISSGEPVEDMSLQIYNLFNKEAGSLLKIKLF